MKQVLLDFYGEPAEAARCGDVADLVAPGPGQVLFDVLLFPINPADVWFCRGSYRLKPPLPATPGAECVGRVRAVGAGVTHVGPGDLVINLQRENWTQARLVDGNDVVKLPAGMDLKQAAMVRINPPTALLLLTDIVDLQPGEWVIQNVANSAVGRLLIVLAKQRGLKTINLVRRESLFAELKELGADVCLVDGPDIAQRVAAATGNARIRLGIDAVSGSATGRIATCLASDGKVCNYGAMTGEDPQMPRSEVIYRGVTLTGFMLGRFMARRSLQQIRAIYADLGGQVADGKLHAPVEKVYAIDDIKTALAHAQKSERSGKILVAPNGPF